MPTYQQDIVAWSTDQARLIRAGRFAELDLEHIADAVEDVGKSEQRELASRMAVLIGHLLKWKYQPERRGASWDKTIKAQRKELAYALDESPSLRGKLAEVRWIDLVWTKGVAFAVTETGLDCFPDECIWSVAGEILNPLWLLDRKQTRWGSFVTPTYMGPEGNGSPESVGWGEERTPTCHGRRNRVGVPSSPQPNMSPGSQRISGIRRLR